MSINMTMLHLILSPCLSPILAPMHCCTPLSPNASLHPSVPQCMAASHCASLLSHITMLPRLPVPLYPQLHVRLRSATCSRRYFMLNMLNWVTPHALKACPYASCNAYIPNHAGHIAVLMGEESMSQSMSDPCQIHVKSRTLGGGIHVRSMSDPCQIHVRSLTHGGVGLHLALLVGEEFSSSRHACAEALIRHTLA